MTEMSFEVGQKVRCRNKIWEVGKIEPMSGGNFKVRLYPETEGSPSSFFYPLTPIEPLETVRDRLEKLHLDHIDHYRLLTWATRLSLVYEYDKLMSISNSKMKPEPYQLIAVKKVMESLRQRFLIADDVGLGKTIEAGLIMQELTARHRGTRVLIVVPASLQDQWKKEMWDHFHRKFYIYNRRRMEGIQELIDENLNPWLARNSIITSVDWIKPYFTDNGKNTNQVFDQLTKVQKRWDLIILDEAHYASPDSNRGELARALQEKCDALLLLTATPHSGNPDHFFHLLNLIDPYLFASPEDLDGSGARSRVDKVMIRRGKETVYELNDKGELVKKFKDRNPHTVEIEFSKAEYDLYRAVSEYTAESWSKLERKKKVSTSQKNIGRFLLTLVQKRMVSSVYALNQTLQRRIESIVEDRTVDKIDGRSKGEIKQLYKSYERNENLEDDDREAVEKYIETMRIERGHAKKTNEVKTLQNLLSDAQDLLESKEDSKFKWLNKFLRNHIWTDKWAEDGDKRGKVIIFTEYRDTQSYLKKKLLEQTFIEESELVEIHGGMALGENEDEVGTKLWAERRFNERDTKILLATDAASEGLNLQKHCHILINYELPWNPNRLEQRIGRIHRYGQKHVVQIYNLTIKDSKEGEIFKVLQRKIETIRKHLGNMAEVLGVLEKVSLDELILKMLNKDVSSKDVEPIADSEFEKMEKMAEELKKAQFLSGCRQFTKAEIKEAEETIEEAKQTIPTYRDVQKFVEIFLQIYGDKGQAKKDGRVLHSLGKKGRQKKVFHLYVPTIIQDEKLPREYQRVCFDRRLVAEHDWQRGEEPDFIAFGHPLLDRMVHFCRHTKAAELGGKLACLRADTDLPGLIYNFLLRFEDREGRIIREEIEPVFIDMDGQLHPDLGRKLYLLPPESQVPPSEDLFGQIQENMDEFKKKAEQHVHDLYLEYYRRVGDSRKREVDIILEDLEKFHRGVMDTFDKRKQKVGGDDIQKDMFATEAPAYKGQMTKIDNEIKAHHHRMDRRRLEVENLNIGAFPAPELMNMVIVVPV